MATGSKSSSAATCSAPVSALIRVRSAASATIKHDRYGQQPQLSQGLPAGGIAHVLGSGRRDSSPSGMRNLPLADAGEQLCFCLIVNCCNWFRSDSVRGSSGASIAKRRTRSRHARSSRRTVAVVCTGTADRAGCVCFRDISAISLAQGPARLVHNERRGDTCARAR
jgi:hypothetical protein